MVSGLVNIRKSNFNLSIEKAKIITEVYQQTEGESVYLRQARALSEVLNKIPLWMNEDELFTGHPAAIPWGIELDPFLGPIDIDLLKGLEAEGGICINDKDWPEIERIAKYWQNKNWQTNTWQLTDERLWNFLQVGIWLPVMRSKTQGIGAYAGAGLGLYHGLHLAVVNYEEVLNRGLNKIINDVENELTNLRYWTHGDIEKKQFLEAALIILKAIISFASRLSELAAFKASITSNKENKLRLQKISEILKWVPANPARSFHEAIQSFWIIYLLCNPSPTTGMGRFDQYMYPFYKRDISNSSATDKDILDLLCELRLKDMELVRLALRPEKRMQHTGMAKWHNMVIGGVTPTGKDATNELTYLVLEAAKRIRTPHHTITLRVHPGTPDELMIKALEVVKTGIGMPAFVADKSYIEFLLSKGVPLQVARNYALGGCLDVAIPGMARIIEANFFVVPKILEIFLNEGVDPRTGLDIGPFKPELEKITSYDELFEAFKRYMHHFISYWVECTNLQTAVRNDIMKHILESVLFANGIKDGKGFFEIKVPYEINSVLLPVGMINVADSLAVLKRLVFEEKKLSLSKIREALKANWEGYEDVRKMCLAVSKYGNDDDYADLIAKDLYQFLAETITSFDYVFGGKHQPGGISISSMWAGGAITGATPDGRYAGDVLADGSMSPMRGHDKKGPTAIIKSAAKIDQSLYASTLLNMKFHPSSLRTTEDLKKLSTLIKVYFEIGGKHVQFNVVDKETLVEAQKYPEKHADLIVRVAGYSAYFVQLGKNAQDEIIARTELSI